MLMNGILTTRRIMDTRPQLFFALAILSLPIILQPSRYTDKRVSPLNFVGKTLLLGNENLTGLGQSVPRQRISTTSPHLRFMTKKEAFNG
jgi:hypothetical protein